jgi:hypothetical protein
VSNIRLSIGSLEVQRNAVTKVIKHVETLKNYGTVWFKKQGIANILSMSLVKHKFPVRYESTEADPCVVSKPEKDVIFAASSIGLYYNNTTNRAMVMVTTVKGNREGFTNREFMIKNCSVTAYDIDNAHKTFWQ